MWGFSTGLIRESMEMAQRGGQNEDQMAEQFSD